MIRGYRDKTVEQIAQGKAPKGFPTDLVRGARQRLRLLNEAEELRDLRSPPGNQLEALTDDRKGQHAIRINDQWRVCFCWSNGGADDVEIVDYHQAVRRHRPAGGHN